MHSIMSQLMGISALKTDLRNIGNSQRNRRKRLEKLRQKRKVNLKTKCKEEFLNLIVFLIKKRKSVFENIV